MRDIPKEISTENTEKLMAQATHYLDEKYGVNFSNRNPDLVISLATLYALSFHNLQYQNSLCEGQDE